MRKLFLALVAVLFVAPAWAADWKKVINPAELVELRGNVVVIDIRSPGDYDSGHIPGALSAPYGTWRGPKDNPGRVLSDAALTERLQSLGLEQGDKVVISYAGRNETDFGAAARVYWTLKSAGLGHVAILNGGLNAYADAYLPITRVPARAERSSAVFTLSQEWMIDRAGVQDVLDGKRAAIMIDARPAAFWKGEAKHGAAAAAGTLEGSLNITHDSWFRGKRTEIVTGPQVLEIARAAGYVPGETELVSFCNTGHWAATNWFALSELAGIEGVKLYPESMVGWTNAGGRVGIGG